MGIDLKRQSARKEFDPPPRFPRVSRYQTPLYAPRFHPNTKSPARAVSKTLFALVVFPRCKQTFLRLSFSVRKTDLFETE
jgi:hypothetical protein